MKKTITTLMASLLLAGAAAFAQDAEAPAAAEKDAAPAAEATKQDPARPRPQVPDMKERIKRLNADGKALLEMYDADKDGKLNETERAKMDADFELVAKLQRLSTSKAIMDAADEDKNLQLNEAEAKNIRKAMQEMMKKRINRPGPGGQGQRGFRRPNGQRPNRPFPRKDGDAEKPAKTAPADAPAPAPAAE